MNRNVLIAVGLLTAAGGGALIVTRVFGQSAPAADATQGAARGQSVISAAAVAKAPVLPAAAATQPAARAVTFPATLIADESVELYAKASGYVAEIKVDIGSRVRKGDILLRIDVPELLDEVRHNEAIIAARRAKVESMKAKATQAKLARESALAQEQRVEAELRLHRITKERKAQLYQEKAIPQQELDVAENELAVSQADLAIAKARVESARGEELAAQADVAAAEADIAVAQADQARLKTLIAYTAIRAPFDGVVTRRDVDHGAFVRSAAQGAGQSLFTIDKIDRLRLATEVPEIYASLVRPGTNVSIMIRSNGDEPRTASVTRTACSLRADTRTMRTEIDLDNRKGLLMPGMYARVTLTQPDP